MLRRHRDILSIILNTKGFITGNELSKLINVSVRTIRLDIKEINKLLMQYNIKIDSVIKKGYCLSEKNKKILKQNNIIRAVLDYKYIMEIPSTPFERQMYIISRLTNHNNVYIDELEDKLFVSASTINKDIISAKKWLKDNLNFNMSYSLSKGIKLNATEKEKRNIISWIISYKLNNSTLTKHYNYLFEDKDVSVLSSELYHIVNTVTRQYGYFLSGHSSQLFCVEIIIAVKRVKLGCYLESDNENYQYFLPVIIALREKIEEFFKMKLSDSEWFNLQQYFLSKQFISGTNIKNIETEEAMYVVNEFLLKLRKNYNIDLLSDKIVSEKLILYVSPMLNRLKYRHCIANKINEDISQIYPVEFKMASEISDIVKQQFKLNINTIELSYITLSLISMRKFWCRKLNVIIVCDFDESVINYIKEKLVNYLGYKINLSACYTYQQFILGDNKNLEDIDFIVSTSTLADKTNIPFAQVSPIVENKDITNISVYLDHVKKLKFQRQNTHYNGSMPL